MIEDLVVKEVFDFIPRLVLVAGSVNHVVDRDTHIICCF